MGDYYSNAVFTISALTSGVDDDGLFRDRLAQTFVVFDSLVLEIPGLMGLRVSLQTMDKELENFTDIESRMGVLRATDEQGYIALFPKPDILGMSNHLVSREQQAYFIRNTHAHI